MTQEREGRFGADDRDGRAAPVRRQGTKKAHAQVHVDSERDPDDERDDMHPDDAEMTEQERLDTFRGSMQQSVLPDLPDMPGYHLCWLSTTNASDKIAWRLRLGYELITPQMLGGKSSDYETLKTGTYQGVVGINEMVAARIPARAYQTLMAEVHHNQPLRDEKQLKANLDLIKQQAAAARVPVSEEGDGTAELGRAVRAPVFAP